MSSTVYGGSLLMKVENNKNLKNDCEDIYDSYPFKVPKVYLDGTGEEYFPQIPFSWSKDSVVLVRGKQVIEYTQSNFAELLAKDKDGNLIWVDGRTAPYEGCWDGEYLDETRGGKEYTVTEYDIETAQKKKYKMLLDETTEFDSWDYRRLSNFVDADTLGSHLLIKDGMLYQYIGNDKNLVIPDSVTEIGWNTFIDQQQFESITIPKTLIEIPCNISAHCKVNRIEVDEVNPKYYSKAGCLIDRETNTLVWCYSGDVIPDDVLIKKIGANALMNREDINNIVVPNGVEEIEDGAFQNCINLEKIIIPESVAKIGSNSFSNCKRLAEIQLPSSITSISSYTFSDCQSLKSLCLPDSLQVIETGAFIGCDKLKEIELPEDCLEESKNYMGEQLKKENNKWSFTKHQKAKTFADFEF